MKLMLGAWFEGLVEKTCIEASRWLPKRIIPRGDNSPYLARYYIFRKRWLQKTRLPSWVSYAPSIYLHHFLRGDDDKELHNHPYGTSLAFVLFGGYMEQRRERGTDSVGLRVVTAGKFNYLRGDDFHKITLLDARRGAWTIFLAGLGTKSEDKQEWGFWDPATTEFVHHDEHLRRREEQLAF